MIVNSFQIREGLKLTPVAPENIAETTQRADARVWLDLLDYTPAQLEEWLDKLEVDDLGRILSPADGQTRIGPGRAS